MNEIFSVLGIESWKPLFTALLLPPVPLLLLVLVSTRLVMWRRGLAWALLLLAVSGLWLSACSAPGEWLQRSLISPPPPLSVDRIAELRRVVVGGKTGVAIVVLGGGRESRAPEYGVASLSPLSLERLRYGIWLSRETGAPVLFSGGLAHAAQPGASEAEVAADIAARDFLRPLKWTESRSRDTRESAQFTIGALRDQGVKQLVLVTHGWHMARAQRAYQDATAYQAVNLEIVAAPMGLAQRVERPALRWVPSSEGFMLVRAVLREKFGLWLGA